MPEMTVWPVSSSDCTRKVGSSSASFCSEADSLSSSALVFGSMATWMTGSGKTMDSRMIGRDWSHRVSPVAGELETDGRGELAGVDALSVFAVVGVHLEDAADALALVLGGVVDVRARP